VRTLAVHPNQVDRWRKQIARGGLEDTFTVHACAWLRPDELYVVAEPEDRPYEHHFDFNLDDPHSHP
jgi:hypothetical protein